MTNQECKKKRYDIIKPGTKLVKRTKKELIQLLKDKGIEAAGKADEIKKIAENHGILTVIEEVKKEEGWVGKPKGMLQILWERGWIDETKIQDYTVNGKKDALGSTINETSLRYLLGNCEDFINEESMLQYYGRQMGVLVDRTPKCHCELAGEGIEYSWAAAKNKYRRVPVTVKKSKEQFRNLVRECLSRDVITTDLVRAFSRRARRYICAYHAWHEQQRTGNTTQESAISQHLVEKLVKKFKTHRAVIDFDNRFVVAIVKMEQEGASETGSNSN